MDEQLIESLTKRRQPGFGEKLAKGALIVTGKQKTIQKSIQR